MCKRAREVTVGSDCHKSMQISLCDSAIYRHILIDIFGRASYN